MLLRREGIAEIWNYEMNKRGVVALDKDKARTVVVKEENEKKKEYLKSYLRHVRRIHRINEEIREIRSMRASRSVRMCRRSGCHGTGSDTGTVSPDPDIPGHCCQDQEAVKRK